MMFLMFPTNSRADGLPRRLGGFPARGKTAINDNGPESIRKIERSIA
jgi:hypothetical protein